MLWNKQKTYQTFTMEDARRELENDRTITLLDVRSQGEYQRGHIPGSINLPVERIAQADAFVPGSASRVFVYCQSGARSRMAAALLSRMGYMDVTDLGGILAWRGKLERSAGA